MSSNDSNSELVLELAEEFLDRYRNGERPPLSEYTSRHPDLADEILEVFPAMAMMENIAIDEQAVTEEKKVAPVLEQLGDYRIIREAGRGGMGVVYEAEQVSLGRHVALKVLPASMLPDSKHARRFEREAKSAAKLHHTNIVPVFGVGEQDGMHYYVMQFIQGLPLDEVISELRKVQARPTGAITSSVVLGEESGERSVADVARSLMTGQFPRADVIESKENQNDDEVGYGVTELNPLSGDGTPSRASESTNLSGSISGSISSSISLPGKSGVHSSSQSRKHTYWESVANIGLEVADALHYAHQQGILHRDIKPSNLLLDLKGTTWITDFGLAKATDQQDITHTGDILGTLRYMPPEAFEGNTDGRSDIYSLGLTLFELLSFQPAFGERDRHQLIKQVTTEAAPRLDKINPAIPRDLVTIVHKAIERDPGHRYQTAEEMQTDLQRFMYDEPIKARRISLVERLTRWRRRNKGLAVSLATVFLLLLVINIAGPLMTLRMARLNTKLQTTADNLDDAREDAEKKASENLKLAQDARALAEEADLARRETVTMLADMQTERGILAGETDPATAALWFASAANLTPHDPDRQAANHLRARNWLNQSMIPVASLEVPEGSLAHMTFQPKGDLLITLNTAGFQIFHWRLEQPLPWTASLSNVADACWSPDGQQVAVVFRTGDVKLFEIPSGNLRASIPQTAPLYAVQWSPDGQSLAVAGQGVKIWDVSSEPRLQHDWPHPSGVYALQFNQTGDRLVTACDDSQARLFAVTGESSPPAPLFNPIQHIRTSTMAAPVFCDSDQRLVTCSSRGVRHWDEKTGEEITPENLILNDVSNFGLTASADGKWTAATKTSDRYCCVLWNSSGDSSMLQHDNVVIRSIFSPDGQTILTLGWDQMATLWKLPTAGTPSLSVNRFDSPFATGAFSNDSQFVAIGGNSRVVVWQLPPSNVLLGQVESWDLGSKSRGTQRPGQLPPPRPCLSFDGELATLGVWHEGLNPRSRNNVLQAVRTRDGQPAGPVIHCEGNIVDSCICSDNRTVAAVSYANGNGIVSVFDIATGQESWPAITLPSPPLCLETRPNDSHLAVLCREGQLLVLQSETGKIVHEITHENWRIGRDSHIARVAYSPDGSSLVTLGPANQLFVREASGGQLRFPVLKPASQGGFCRGIAFSPDSRLFATAVSDEDTLQVWDLTSGQSVGPPMPHPTAYYGIFAVEFSPDGRWILTAHTDCRLRLWDWQTGKLVIPPMQHADELYDAKFTPDGNYAIAAVRHGGISLWDLKTGKPSAPELKYPPHWNYSLHPSTYILEMNGLRVVAGGDGFFPIVDLSSLIKEPEFSLDWIQAKAKLASSSTLQLGELTRFQDSEWQGMWAEYRESTLTPHSLALQLDNMHDSTSRKMLARQAAELHLLESLVKLRPATLELKEILAQESAFKGDRLSANLYYDEIIRHYELELEQQPKDERIASSLAELLFIRHVPHWSILKPSEMKTDAGTTLSLQDDDSVLASEEPKKNESYVITSRPQPGKMTAIRLDALPHRTLPAAGPGWGGSNFHLTKFSAVLKQAGNEAISLQFRQPSASHSRSLAEGAGSNDGPGAVLDDNHETHWNIWPHPGKPHWLILPLTEPIEISEDDELVVRLDFLDKRWPRAKLGCFRLSATGETDQHDSPRVRQVMDRIDRGDLRGFEALGTYYALAGDIDRSTQCFLTALKMSDNFAVQQRIFEAASIDEKLLQRLRESLPENAALLLQELQHLTESGDPERSELYQRTMSALEQQSKGQPDAGLAGQLAQFLLEEHDVAWTILTPTDIKSRSGTTFEVLDDQSVLAGGANPDSETYTVEFKPELSHITAFRLETMPHPSLPKEGSGRDANGSFWLNEFVVYAYAEPTSRTALPLERMRTAVASFERDSQRSIERAIDGSYSTWWDVWPEVQKPQWAVFPILEFKQRDTPDRLIVRMEFRGPSGSQPTIGRFRLSYTDNERSIASLIAERQTNPWVRLIAAYHLQNRKDAMTRLIEQHPEVHSELAGFFDSLQDWEHALALYNGLISIETKDPILLAKRAEAYFESGNLVLAEADWQRAFELDSKRFTLPQQIVAKLEQGERWTTLARFYSTMLDRYPESRTGSSPRSRLMQSIIRRKTPLFDALRQLRTEDTLLPVSLARDYVLQCDWKNAAKHYAVVENDPPSEEWFEYAAALLMAGEKDSYRAFMTRSLEQVGYVEDPFTAFYLARALSLSTEAVVDRKQVVKWGELSVTAKVDPWLTHAAGLAHLRAGDYEQALKRLEQSAGSVWEPQLNHLALALLYGQQDNLPKAREYFALAEKWFTEHETQRGGYATDWLEANLLRKEVQLILDPKE